MLESHTALFCSQTRKRSVKRVDSLGSLPNWKEPNFFLKEPLRTSHWEHWYHWVQNVYYFRPKNSLAPPLTCIFPQYYREHMTKCWNSIASETFFKNLTWMEDHAHRPQPLWAQGTILSLHFSEHAWKRLSLLLFIQDIRQGYTCVSLSSRNPFSV